MQVFCLRKKRAEAFALPRVQMRFPSVLSGWLKILYLQLNFLQLPLDKFKVSVYNIKRMLRII